MIVNKRRLLMVTADEQRERHLNALLEGEDWLVEHQAVGRPLPVGACGNYDVVLYDATTGGGQREMIGLLEHFPSHDSAVVLPILGDSTPAGVVSLIRLGVVDVLLTPFSDREFIDIVNRVAGHRDLYLENLAYRDKLEKVNRELHDSLTSLKMDQLAGRQVQKNLLPRTPLVYGEYTVAHRITPSLYLSGDFVGYNVVLDRYLLFYLADVSGHGASSAFVTILLRFLLRRIVRRHTNDNDLKALARAPEGFMEHINRHIIATGLDKHLTMFAGAVDMKANMLRYSVASQMPMPIFVVDGDARFLPGRGKPVGIFEDARWDVEEIALPRNFTLVAASDGLLETIPGESLEAKEAHLLDVASQGAADHDDLCRRLGMDALDNVVDDVSILSIVRKGEE